MGGWVGGCALSVCLQEKSQHMNGGDCRESAVAWERGDLHSLSSAKGEGGFLPGLLRHHKGNGPWSHDPPLLERLQESIWEPLIIHTWDKAPGQKGINSGEELWWFIVKVFTRLHLLLSLGVSGFVLNFWSICDHPINRQQNIYADTRMWQCVCVCVCVFHEPVSASKEFFTHYDLLISWIFLAYDCPVNNASFHLSLHLPQVATDDLKISLSTQFLFSGSNDTDF